VLRTWVAYADFTKDVEVGPITLTKSADAIKKIRNTIRFCMANLADFKTSDAVPYEKLTEVHTHLRELTLTIQLDQFVLHKLHGLIAELEKCYDNLAFYSVIRNLSEFCINDASTFYFEITKDRLYTDAVDSPMRRSCQTVLNEVHTTVIDNIHVAIDLSSSHESLCTYCC
jgi:isoleucyl-tRNA synthetase